MDLVYDWKAFTSVFGIRGSVPRRQDSGHVLVVADNGKVVAAYAESEDLTSWTGSRCEKMAAEMPHRKLVVLEKKSVDGLLEGALSHPHYHGQFEILAKNAAALTGAGASIREFCTFSQKHFLLTAMSGWWTRILPSYYGIFVSLGASRQVLLTVRKGQVESFLNPEGERPPLEAVKYLSEKHLLPVQGIFTSAEKWNKLSEAPNPWPGIFEAIRGDEIRLVPYNRKLLCLLAMKAYVGV
ncbi:MAG: hypothetical protein AABZ06_14880 [Bdellovibrionota bacterium]